MDKKISELIAKSAIDASDVSILVNNNVDYQFTFTTLLTFLSSNLSVGSNISFGNTLPQNTTGKNADVFVNTSANYFAQKISGTWTIVYTLPSSGGQKDGTVLYGLGMPVTATGNNNDTYINTVTGIFYKKTADAWNQVFTMLNGPAGVKGDKGDKGDTGLSGNTILNGTTNPSNLTDGTNGDFYFKTTTLELFGPKTAGVWGNAVSLAGPSLPNGGAIGQVLKKQSSTDDDTIWSDEQDISGKANITYVDTQDGAEANLRQSSDEYLQDQINNKVEKLTGYGLSQENYTTSEKTKLANLSEHYKGTYTSAAALATANPTGSNGDYAFVDTGTGADAKMYIWDSSDNAWVLSSGSGVIPDATEGTSGIIALATVAEALARTNDTKAMTALKTISLILDENKNVDRQIAPIGVNEVSFLMRNAGNVTALTIAGATNAKLKIGIASVYPVGAQTYPFAYAAGDRVFVTYNYSDLNNASCNIILTCRDN